MKKMMSVFAAILWLTGCSAFYGNEAQYDKGDWYLLASSREMARIKQDKLAFEKLRTAPVKTETTNGVPRGYKGLLYNSSLNRYANIIVRGPEEKSFYLKPGGREDYSFVPGTYIAVQYDEYGYRRGNPWVFHVNAQTNNFMGEEVHWYLVAPP